MKEFEMPPRLNVSEKKEAEEFSAEFLYAVEKGASESEGFISIDAENIRIIPAENGAGGIVEIVLPEKPRGIDEFQKRDSFEKEFPSGLIKNSAEFENEVFCAEKTAQPFSPEFGARVCLTVVKQYETKEGKFISLPILPNSDHTFSGKERKYAGHAKLAGSNLLRGNNPNAKALFVAAKNKEESNLEKIQRENSQDKIISNGELVKTGIWTMRFFDKKGGHFDVKNCHIQRDVQTGTLDAFLISNQFVFAGFDEIVTQEKFKGDLKRINSIASLEKLKNAKPGEELELEKLIWEGKEIKSVSQIPAEYEGIFIEKDGKIFLKEYKAVPALKAFLEQEKKVISATSDVLEIEIRTRIGQEFEKMLERKLQVKKNGAYLPAEVPRDKNELAKIIDGFPEDFKSWAMAVAGKEIRVHPDFILADGTFVEAKSGGKIELKPEKREQLYRMALYKMVRGEDLKIKIISLEGETCEDFILPGVQYENILQSGDYDENDFAEILSLRKILQEKQENGK